MSGRQLDALGDDERPSIVEQTEVFARVVINVIVAVETAYLLNCRSLTRSPMRIGFFRNRAAVLGVAGMIMAQVAFTYLPVMNTMFQSQPIRASDWLAAAAIGWLAFVIVEFEKWVRFGRGKSSIMIAD